MAQQTSNWLAATKQILGPQASGRWLLALMTDDMEIHVSPEKSLVLVDRQPIVSTPDGEAFLRSGLFGMAGDRLILEGEIDAIDDSLLHGRYAGTLDGQAVIMDHYLMFRNDVPIGSMRIIRSAQGSGPVRPYSNMAYVRSLMGEDHRIVDRTGTVDR